MTWAARLRGLPLSWKVPLLGAGLMVGIALMISQVVLSRLAADQESNLRTLTNAYLDGISAAVIQPTLRGDVWEAFDALDRARTHYSGVASRFVIIQLPDNKVLASSEPLRFPVQSDVPVDILGHFPTKDDLIIDYDNGRAWLSRTLQLEGHSIGRLLAEIDVAPLLQVRRHVLWTLILANSGMTFIFVAIGYATLRRMLRPLGTLTGYVEQVREGYLAPIPEGMRNKLSAEFRSLFDRFDAMAHALNERETLAAHLAAQEKFAVLGKLASGMAHEVNNPLGGIFNALDLLRRHGADPNIRDSTLTLLQRGLDHIRNVVRATLVTYKPEALKYELIPEDIDDLRVLIEPEASRRQLVLNWRNELRGKTHVAVGSVRQATLNLLLNACAATPSEGRVSLRAGINEDTLVIEVSDEGPGFPSALAAYLVAKSDEGALPGGGLGLWIIRRLVQDEHGSIEVVRSRSKGTIVRVTWPLRHEDGAESKSSGVTVNEEAFDVG